MGDLLQPWHILVLLFVFSVFFLIPAIFYMLTLQNTLNKCAPASRAMDPGMVWLLLIPVFNLIWNFFVVMNIAKSLASEYARRGIPSPEPMPGQSIGLAMSICACCCIIPVLGFLAGLANLVLWVLYWVKIAEYSRILDVPQIVLPTAPRI
jgi:hypothetical protein